jgi:hypothetical protein
VKTVVVPLERWPIAREKWRLAVDDRNLTVITPEVKAPWVIPLASVAGVCDLSQQTDPDDGLILVRGAQVVEMHQAELLGVQSVGRLAPTAAVAGASARPELRVQVQASRGSDASTQR